MRTPFFVPRQTTYFCHVKTIRRIVRFLFFCAYTLRIVAEIWLNNLFRGTDTRRSMRIRRRWANNLIRGVGVSIQTTGEAPNFPCVIVCNHRSYLDPILLLRDIDGYPVAKAELAKWPIIGRGARMAGILYLRRAHAGSRSGILRQMLGRIEAGYPIIIVPEGTTSSVSGTIAFQKGAFKLAAQAGIPVVPAAIVFADKRDYWVGKQTFLGHAMRRFGAKKIEVKLIYGPKILHENPERLLHSAKSWIDDALMANPPDFPQPAHHKGEK